MENIKDKLKELFNRNVDVEMNMFFIFLSQFFNDDFNYVTMEKQDNLKLSYILINNNNFMNFEYPKFLRDLCEYSNNLKYVKIVKLTRFNLIGVPRVNSILYNEDNNIQNEEIEFNDGLCRTHNIIVNQRINGIFDNNLLYLINIKQFLSNKCYTKYIQPFNSRLNPNKIKEKKTTSSLVILTTNYKKEMDFFIDYNFFERVLINYNNNNFQYNNNNMKSFNCFITFFEETMNKLNKIKENKLKTTITFSLSALKHIHSLIREYECKLKVINENYNEFSFNVDNLIYKLSSLNKIIKLNDGKNDYEVNVNDVNEIKFIVDLHFKSYVKVLNEYNLKKLRKEKIEKKK